MQFSLEKIQKLKFSLEKIQQITEVNKMNKRMDE